MLNNDPATHGRTSGSQLTDVLATIILLIGHFFFFGATFMAVGLLAINTASCDVYQKCGDRAWLDRALHLSLWAGGAILFADVVITVIRLVRQRVAWFVPVTGCVAQLAVAFGAAAVESLAGAGLVVVDVPTPPAPGWHCVAHGPG